MYYGYVDQRPAQGTCIIITRPCSTKEEAEAEFAAAFGGFPKPLKTDMYGRQHGVLRIGEHVHIPAGKLGTKITYA